eukprot:scaffold14995_cov92-Cylindrotheca_fusiformis.AAC.4
MESGNMDESSEVEEGQPEYFVYSWISKFLVRIRKETLTHLRVDFSVRAIPERAFKDCQALTHVLLPESISRIGESAFQDCENLKCVQATLQIDNYAFSGCYSLRKVVIRSVSTKLGEGVFLYCRGLSSVELPEGLEVIQTRLFAHCKSLTTLRIPTSVKQIGDCAFCGSGMISIDLPQGLKMEGICKLQRFKACRTATNLEEN